MNIGDIAHTPGVLALLERHLPDVEVRLWPSKVDNGVEEMLRARFPKVRVVKSAEALKAAFAECDFLLHGSGPSLVLVHGLGATGTDLWKKHIADLAAFLATLRVEEPVFFVGLGSNLLVRDGGLRGTVVFTHPALGGIALAKNTSGADSSVTYDLARGNRTSTLVAGNLTVVAGSTSGIDYNVYTSGSNLNPGTISVPGVITLDNTWGGTAGVGGAPTSGYITSANRATLATTSDGITLNNALTGGKGVVLRGVTSTGYYGINASSAVTATTGNINIFGLGYAGAGFIGTNFVLTTILGTGEDIVTLDKLTYAGNLDSLAPIAENPRYAFRRADICDPASVAAAFADFQPDVVMHLAAESHVDRSIDGPDAFIQTNLVGTFTMLSAARSYWQSLEGEAKNAFRFHHISTDEVYGSLGDTGLFTEETPYDPRSPYSASKAGSDHLVSAWGHTYGLPVLITNCSNNYGPYQFPEKLIPLMIVKALAGETLPVYGKGDQVRDWLFVEDHVRALQAVFERGRVGRTYNVGGNNEKQNIEVVQAVCAILDRLRPRSDGQSYATQIGYVADRPGHDKRYAIDATRIEQELGWRPAETFETGMRKTVRWFLDHPDWVRDVTSGAYRQWVTQQYG